MQASWNNIINICNDTELNDSKIEWIGYNNPISIEGKIITLGSINQSWNIVRKFQNSKRTNIYMQSNTR